MDHPVRVPATVSTAPRPLLPLGMLVGALLGGQWFTPEPLVIAVLMDDSGNATAVVKDFGGANVRIRCVDQLAFPARRQMQVWTLPSPELRPVSMGSLTVAQGTALDAPSLPKPIAGQRSEITLEPLGKSPTGGPTGMIRAKGLAARQGTTWRSGSGIHPRNRFRLFR